VFVAKGAYTLSFKARMPYERVSNPEYGTAVVSSGLDPDAGCRSGPFSAIGSTTDPTLGQALERPQQVRLRYLLRPVPQHGRGFSAGVD